MLSAISYIIPDMTKKPLYLNGVIVGEVEQTGDPQKDIQMGRDFLESKGLLKEITVPQVMFRQARSFANTASYLQRGLLQIPANALDFAPFVVNSTFSIELYLKILLTLAGRSNKACGHSLLDLYEKLPSDTKVAMLSAAKQAAKKYQVRVEQLSDLRNLVSALDKAFVEWRYLYEKSSTPVFQFWEAILVMDAADETCRAFLGANTELTRAV